MVESLADTLASLRKTARISQDALAEVAGVARGTIKGIEKGKTGQHPKTLALIADGLATDGAGVRNEEQSRLYYSRLMVAAGYCPRAPVGESDLDGVLAALFPTTAVPVLRSALQEIAELAPDDQSFAVAFLSDQLPRIVSLHNGSGRAGRLDR